MVLGILSNAESADKPTPRLEFHDFSSTSHNLLYVDSRSVVQAARVLYHATADLPRPAPVQEEAAAKSHEPLGVYIYAFGFCLHAATSFLLGRRALFRQIGCVCHPGGIRRFGSRAQSRSRSPARLSRCPPFDPRHQASSPTTAPCLTCASKRGSANRTAPVHSARHGSPGRKGFTRQAVF